MPLIRPSTLALAVALVACGRGDQLPPPAFGVEEATIAQIHEAMAAGALTARGLVEAYLARIEAYDKQGPALNAIITVNPHALARAATLDAAFEQREFLESLGSETDYRRTEVDTFLRFPAWFDSAFADAAPG